MQALSWQPLHRFQWRRAHNVVSFGWLSFASLGLFSSTRPSESMKHNSSKGTTNHLRKRTERTITSDPQLRSYRESAPTPAGKKILNKTRSVVCKIKFSRTSKAMALIHDRDKMKSKPSSLGPRVSFPGEENLM